MGTKWTEARKRKFSAYMKRRHQSGAYRSLSTKRKPKVVKPNGSLEASLSELRVERYRVAERLTHLDVAIKSLEEVRQDLRPPQKREG